MSFLEHYIEQGGFFIYPIILFFLWAMVIAVERAIYYMQTASLLKRQRTKIFSILSESGVESLHEHLKTQKGLIRNVLYSAVDNRHLSTARIEEKMSIELTRYLPAYSKFLNMLATLAGIMPMLGLLGTVTGMIATFKIIALEGSGDAQAMAGGISEALITTQAGLVLAVPIILSHQFLTGRMTKITDTTREICLSFIDALKDSESTKHE